MKKYRFEVSIKNKTKETYLIYHAWSKEEAMAKASKECFGTSYKAVSAKRL